MGSVSTRIVDTRRVVLRHYSGTHKGTWASLADRVIEHSLVSSYQVEAHRLGAKTPLQIYIVDKIAFFHSAYPSEVLENKHCSRGNQKIGNKIGFTVGKCAIGAQ